MGVYAVTLKGWGDFGVCEGDAPQHVRWSIRDSGLDKRSFGSEYLRWPANAFPGSFAVCNKLLQMQEAPSAVCFDQFLGLCKMGRLPIQKFQALAFSDLNSIRDVFVRPDNLAPGAAVSEARTDQLASFRRDACAASLAQGSLVRAWRKLCSKQRKWGPGVEVYPTSSRQLDGFTGAEVQGKFVEVLMAWFHAWRHQCEV